MHVMKAVEHVETLGLVPRETLGPGQTFGGDPVI